MAKVWKDIGYLYILKYIQNLLITKGKMLTLWYKNLAETILIKLSKLISPNRTDTLTYTAHGN